VAHFEISENRLEHGAGLRGFEIAKRGEDLLPIGEIMNFGATDSVAEIHAKDSVTPISDLAAHAIQINAFKRRDPLWEFDRSRDPGQGREN
jgi:hypothetical protein